MPDRERTRREVLQMIAEIADLPVERVPADATLESLDIDSLNGLRIVAEMEKRYGINIPEETIGRIRSIPDILALVDAHLPGE